MFVKGKLSVGTGFSSGWQVCPQKTQFFPPLFLSLREAITEEKQLINGHCPFGGGTPPPPSYTPGNAYREVYTMAFSSISHQDLKYAWYLGTSVKCFSTKYNLLVISTHIQKSAQKVRNWSDPPPPPPTGQCPQISCFSSVMASLIHSHISRLSIVYPHLKLKLVRVLPSPWGFQKYSTLQVVSGKNPM